MSPNLRSRGVITNNSDSSANDLQQPQQPGSHTATAPASDQRLKPDSSEMMTTVNGLIGALPGELQNQIFDYLDYPSAIFLAATNRYFRSIIDPVALVSDEDKICFLKYAESYMVEDLGVEMACLKCFKIRGIGCFDVVDPRSIDPLDRRSDLRTWERLTCTDCACHGTPSTYQHDLYSWGLCSEDHAFDEGKVLRCTACLKLRYPTGRLDRGSRACEACGNCICELLPREYDIWECFGCGRTLSHFGHMEIYMEIPRNLEGSRLVPIGWDDYEKMWNMRIQVFPYLLTAPDLLLRIIHGLMKQTMKNRLRKEEGAKQSQEE